MAYDGPVIDTHKEATHKPLVLLTFNGSQISRVTGGVTCDGLKR
jgi:hypothetical protein